MSGILLNEESVRRFIAIQGDASVRAVVIGLENGSFSITSEHPAGASLDADIPSILDSLTVASYLIVRVDEKRLTIFAYVPDNTPVKPKMMFGASFEGIKRQLQAYTSFAANAHVSEKSELSAAEIVSRLLPRDANEASELLSERELNTLREALAEQHVSTPGIAQHGVAFPFSTSAQAALQSFAKQEIHSCSFSLPLDGSEAIDSLSNNSSSMANLASISSSLDTTRPSFTLARLASEDGASKGVVFIFCSPDSCSIKLKMKSATCKAAIQQAIAAADVKVNGVIEITEASDLSEDSLFTAAGLPKSAGSSASAAGRGGFAKPARPGRGGARLAK